jgi:hypothetical protein
VLAIKRFKNGFGIGFVESWIQQVDNDGGAPSVLTGFVGRVVPAFAANAATTSPFFGLLLFEIQ